MQKSIFASLLAGGVFFVFNFTAAATATHVVISQVQIDGVDGTGGTEKDFIELYNPTSQSVDISGWKLRKKTTSGSESSIRVFPEGSSVPAFGYFLWARSSEAGFAESLGADATSTASLAENNSVALKDSSDNLIDALAWGSGHTNPFLEGAAASNPADGASIERKPGSGQGNGEDSNNNSADFFAQSTAHARNTLSATETPPTPSSPPPPAGGETSGGGTGGFFELEISEIMPNPKGKDAGFEWVEVYNAGGNLVNISGWKIDDDGADDTPSSNAHVLPDGTSVAGKGYLVIQIPKGKFSLNNTGTDAVRIFDAGGVLKLRQNYSGPAKEGYSYAKNSSNAWDWTENATPGSANLFAILTTYSSSLRISEVLPNPEGDDAEGEFIEIHNYGSDSVDLADWVIADERKRYIISDEDFADTEIPAGGYFVIYREVSGISLNNSGEEITRLINPVGELVDEFAFNASGKEGEAYAWEFGEVYRWTNFFTPGEKNVFVVAEEKLKNKNPRRPAPEGAADGGQAKSKIEIPLGEVKSQPLGTIITTSGVVVVEPGILGERVSYLQGSGMRISLPENLPITLLPGMNIQLQGELSTFHNEFQLKVADSGSIVILAENQTVDVHEIKTGEVGEQTEGFLVKIAGEVSESSGDTFYLDDGTGEARVYIRESTGIQKPKMKQGMNVQAVGVVSQFNDVYRVMPRYQDDLVIAAVAGAADPGQNLPRTGTNFWLSVAFFAAICYIVIHKSKLTQPPLHLPLVKGEKSGGRKVNQNEQS